MGPVMSRSIHPRIPRSACWSCSLTPASSRKVYRYVNRRRLEPNAGSATRRRFIQGLHNVAHSWLMHAPPSFSPGTRPRQVDPTELGWFPLPFPRRSRDVAVLQGGMNPVWAFPLDLGHTETA